MFEQYTQDGKLLIRKVLPYQLYDMTGLARWFEEMSSPGLIFGPLWASGPPFSIRTSQPRGPLSPGAPYRLLGQLPGLRPNEAYAQSGWEYVTNIDPYYYRANDPEAEELHTDPVTQGLCL